MMSRARGFTAATIDKDSFMADTSLTKVTAARGAFNPAVAEERLSICCVLTDEEAATGTVTGSRLLLT
jgi:hypothetical protein